jgi:hypothetical protein
MARTSPVTPRKSGSSFSAGSPFWDSDRAKIAARDSGLAVRIEIDVN